MPASLSVILPTMDRPADLGRFLASLLAQTVRPEELVVVDAGASVEARVAEAVAGSGIRLVYLRSTPGTSLQRNVGIEAARGEILFFLDDDMVLEPDYVARSLEGFELPFDPPVGAVMGTITNMGPEPAPLALLYGLLGVSHFTTGDVCHLYPTGGSRWLVAPSRPVPVPVVATGRVAYRRDALGEERFSEFLPGYTFAEDVELAIRVGRRWTLLQHPGARLAHHHSPVGRVGYGDRVGRVLFSRYHFFAHHTEKTALNAILFGLGHSSEVAQISLAGLLGRKAGPLELGRGLARGYGRCVREALNRTRDTGTSREAARAHDPTT
ncbi:MAG: glycosyltransferase family 2 protein [Pseudomonadota bacterium]